MILEHALFDIVPGQGDEFVAAYTRARPHITGADGCRRAELRRCVEDPDRFLLLVEWDTLEAHTEGFRGSPAFAEWRRILGPLFAAPPDVLHYEAPLSG